jgi:hypothetical protein
MFEAEHIRKCTSLFVKVKLHDGRCMCVLIESELFSCRKSTLTLD